LRKLPADPPHRFDKIVAVLLGQIGHLAGQAGAQPIVELLGRDAQTLGPGQELTIEAGLKPLPEGQFVEA